MPKLVTVLIVLLVVLSCATAPEAPPEDPAPEVAAVPEVPTVPRPDAERSQAQELRATIEDYELAVFAPDDYQEGEALFAIAEGAYDTDNATAQRNYLAAIQSYTRVIDQGIESISNRKRFEVEEAKQQADGIRARVTQTGVYDGAQSDWDAAENHLAGARYLDALDAFDAARDGFLTAYRRASEARRRALRALDDADGTISESEREIEGLQQDLDAEDA
ncbi:MAG: hypothetical protein EA384_12260 [Spirochaetaceae bacterium]|nr:MAG: hypothetical protein EA384_12260 [Spirochaetaceae bacterium]